MGGPLACNRLGRPPTPPGTGHRSPALAHAKRSFLIAAAHYGGPAAPLRTMWAPSAGVGSTLVRRCNTTIDTRHWTTVLVGSGQPNGKENRSLCDMHTHQVVCANRDTSRGFFVLVYVHYVCTKGHFKPISLSAQYYLYCLTFSQCASADNHHDSVWKQLLHVRTPPDTARTYSPKSYAYANNPVR